jgi:hypothetical protein
VHSTGTSGSALNTNADNWSMKSRNKGLAESFFGHPHLRPYLKVFDFVPNQGFFIFCCIFCYSLETRLPIGILNINPFGP